MTVSRYFWSGTMTISCFFVRSRSNFNSSCQLSQPLRNAVFTQAIAKKGLLLLLLSP